MHSLKEFQEIVKNHLLDKEFIQEPDRLFDPMHYILAVGGKRIRPVLVLLAAEMYGGSIKEAMKPALGIELFHNFTLLHDDVMDRAELRRGQKTVHKKWDENVAILSGDAISIKAYQYIVSCEDGKVRDMLEIFNTTALEVCKGQQFDMEFESRQIVSYEEYLQMIEYKTAVLFGCSLKMGGILGEADSTQRELLYQIGINLGMAFQLQDDYLDVFGDTAVFGKKIGNDIIANKKTFLLVKSFELADEATKQELSSLLQDTNMENKQKIEAVTNIYQKLDIATITEQKIQAYVKMCKKNISLLQVAESKKDVLHQLVAKLEYRVM